MSEIKENRDKGAFASESEHSQQEGLTKREYFAIECLKGMLASRTEHENPQVNPMLAIEVADQLLKDLEVEPENENL
jgi:hypothetical protein